MNTARPRTEWEREARKKLIDLNMTIADLAKAVGKSCTSVSRTLCGGYNLSLGKQITELLDLKTPYPGTE